MKLYGISKNTQRGDDFYARLWAGGRGAQINWNQALLLGCSQPGGEICINTNQCCEEGSTRAVPAQKEDSDPAQRTSWRRQYLNCVLKDERMSRQGTAGAKAQRHRAHMPVGNCKWLGIDRIQSGKWWEMWLERIARALEAMRGVGSLDFIPQVKLWREEGVRAREGYSIVETLRSLLVPSQQTLSCLHDHRRSLFCLFHQTVSSSAWT